jgi:hypothetical protein
VSTHEHNLTCLEEIGGILVCSVTGAMGEKKAEPIRFTKYDKSGLPQKVSEAFQTLGHAQRVRPEDAMLAATHFHAGVMAYELEHVGDLTHRMTVAYPQETAGYEYVREKVTRALRHLRNPYGYRKEHEGNIESNSRYRKVDKGEYTAKFKRLLASYAAEHGKLPVYNEAQLSARDAAIAIGREDFRAAEANLARLEQHLGSKDEWVCYAHAYTLDSAGRPVRIG